MWKSIPRKQRDSTTSTAQQWRRRYICIRKTEREIEQCNSRHNHKWSCAYSIWPVFSRYAWCMQQVVCPTHDRQRTNKRTYEFNSSKTMKNGAKQIENRITCATRLLRWVSCLTHLSSCVRYGLRKSIAQSSLRFIIIKSWVLDLGAEAPLGASQPVATDRFVTKNEQHWTMCVLRFYFHFLCEFTFRWID